MSQSTAELSTEAQANGSHIAPGPGTDANTAEIERIFQLQQSHQYTVAKTTARERKEKLKRLEAAFLAHREEIRAALYADFRKHPSEVDLTEVFPVTSEIKHARRHLSKWMRPNRVKTPMALLGARSYVHYEPKGVVLIIAPWNFPINLTFGPLVAAIAAGNCVMIKPSEHTPHSSAVTRSIIAEVFDESEVAVVEGGIETSTAVLAQPFNHIFFTGAPSIGKIVMEAAAKHLGSVTLELGGKSPTIVDETAQVDAAAHRVAWAKYTNNGQICLAPDYVFVHESKKDEFLQKLTKNIEKFYGIDARRSDSYARIVNKRHYQRLNGYLEDAKDRGATVAYGGRTEGSEDYIEPTVLTDVDQLLLERVVRRGQQVERGERCDLLQDASCVGKRLEPEEPVAFADAAVVGATERKVVVEEVHGAVVDARATGARVLNDALLIVATSAVDVESEGLFFGIDRRDRLVQRLERVNRKKRPENLVRHHLGRRIHVGEHRRLDVVLAAFGAAAVHDGGALVLGVLEVAVQPLIVAAVDDSRV